MYVVSRLVSTSGLLMVRASGSVSTITLRHRERETTCCAPLVEHPVGVLLHHVVFID